MKLADVVRDGCNIVLPYCEFHAGWCLGGGDSLRPPLYLGRCLDDRLSRGCHCHSGCSLRDRLTCSCNCLLCCRLRYCNRCRWCSGLGNGVGCSTDDCYCCYSDGGLSCRAQGLPSRHLDFCMFCEYVFSFLTVVL